MLYLLEKVIFSINSGNRHSKKRASYNHYNLLSLKKALFQQPILFIMSKLMTFALQYWSFPNNFLSESIYAAFCKSPFVIFPEVNGLIYINRDRALETIYGKFFQENFLNNQFILSKFNPLSAIFTKWSSTLKQLVEKLPMNWPFCDIGV